LTLAPFGPLLAAKDLLNTQELSLLQPLRLLNNKLLLLAANPLTDLLWQKTSGDLIIQQSLI
jgi:hypothetical protein